MQNFTNIQDKLYSFNIHDDQSWAFSKITQYYGQPVLAFDKRQICSASFARVNIYRVTLQHNKEFIMFIFYSVIL